MDGKKVPDDLPEEDGWRLNRNSYYQEGWLATGNMRGIVGVTFTTSHCKKHCEMPPRTNFNLRGHRSEVVMVQWNEPYQKLASCDSSGIIFVWIKYEGRWSIELINDRSTPVTYFCWSHDGRMALICYQDGFVLVGSVAGQRYWSSMLNLESTQATVTSGCWTPDDKQVFFGTSSGELVVMDVHGALVSQLVIKEGQPIVALSWNCPRFKMEEGEDGNETAPGGIIVTIKRVMGLPYTLAVCFKNGVIQLMRGYDDPSPISVQTEMTGLRMEWSNSGELLAVAGMRENTGIIKFLTPQGSLLYQVPIPPHQHPISAMTWGHNDKRLILATGSQVWVAWVSRRLPSLQNLCRVRISQLLTEERLVHALPFPRRLRTLIQTLFAETIRSYIPETNKGPWALRDFVMYPPVKQVRLHCTMIRSDDESGSASYTLYLEYLGGLLPLLKGKRCSKIRPEFVIFDPQPSDDSSNNSSPSGSQLPSTDSSDTEHEEQQYCPSPRLAHRRLRKDSPLTPRSPRSPRADSGSDEKLPLPPTLKGQERLVEVTSNIWGTKFKIIGISPYLPVNLGQVVYKTSLLHLQPRQMTLYVTEVSKGVSRGEPDPNFNPHVFSEDEEDTSGQPSGSSPTLVVHKEAPVAPILSHRSSSNNLMVPHSRPQPSRSRDISEGIEGASYVGLIAQPEVSAAAICTPTLPQSPKHTVAPSPSTMVELHIPATGISTVQRRKNSLLNRAKIETAQLEASPRISESHISVEVEDCPAPVIPSTSSRLPTPSSTDVLARWAAKAEDLLYIDEEAECSEGASTSSQSSRMSSYVRSRSVGQLAMLDTVGPNMAVSNSRPSLHAESPRRLVLAQPKRKKPPLSQCGKSRSLDSSPKQKPNPEKVLELLKESQKKMEEGALSPPCCFKDLKAAKGPKLTHEKLKQVASGVAGGSRSNPATPATRRKVRRHQSSSPVRYLWNSPLLSRKARARRLQQQQEESEDDSQQSQDEGQDVSMLESFHRSILENKLHRSRRKKSDSNIATGRRQMILFNKAPLWNETSQVYQLDFGGRVTQESAKNFQIEMGKVQVMQFGRIDSNAYTLDFQYPFSAVQAFAVALANVTQRLK